MVCGFVMVPVHSSPVSPPANGKGQNGRDSTLDESVSGITASRFFPVSLDGWKKLCQVVVNRGDAGKLLVMRFACKQERTFNASVRADTLDCQPCNRTFEYRGEVGNGIVFHGEIKVKVRTWA